MRFADVMRSSTEEVAPNSETPPQLRPAGTNDAGSRRKRSRRAPVSLADGAPVATRSLELDVELTRFSTRARAARGSVPTGAPMPADQRQAWKELLEVTAAFLSRPVEETSSFDVVRARVALEAELEMDARAYGAFPAELADRATEQVSLLAARMVEVRRAGVRTAHRKMLLDWPVEPVVVTSLFGRRLHPVLKVYRTHQGIDLKASPGQLVSASAGGVVAFSGWNGGHGWHVEVRHPGGLVTKYSHLSQLLVEAGDSVERGSPVGLAGDSGRATGVHVHFELFRDGMPSDPLETLGQPAPGTVPLASLQR